MKSSNKIFVDYRYLVGFCACLRQADLSVDRGRWTSWDEVRTFYSSKTDEGVFFDFIVDLCEKLKLRPLYHVLKRKDRPFNYLMFSLYPFFNRKSFITSKELEMAYYLIDEFKNMLRIQSPEPKDIECLRLRIADYCSYVLLPKLTKRDGGNVLRMEHYLENERLNTLTLKEIVDSVK